MTENELSLNRDYDTELEEIRKLWKDNNVLQSNVLNSMNEQHDVTETIVANNTSGTSGGLNAK